MRGSRSGLTLLEVMGAVAILGLASVWLITPAMDATVRAGQARDRLNASLLADDVLAELETRAASEGIAPGTHESERDGFRISVTAVAADASALLAAHNATPQQLARLAA